MRKGCRILDGELAVSTGPGPMAIGVGAALPGGKKLLGRSARWAMQKVCKEGLSTLLPLTVLSPFPLQLSRQPLVFSAYYVLDLGFITVNF